MLALRFAILHQMLPGYLTHALCFQTVAGIFSLLNDFRLSKGRSSLGFINPLIYSTAVSGFNDITSGSNPGCGTNGKVYDHIPFVSFFNAVCLSGFIAGSGWDPVS